MSEQDTFQQPAPLATDAFALLGLMVLGDEFPTAALGPRLGWSSGHCDAVLGPLLEAQAVKYTAEDKVACTESGRALYFNHVAWLSRRVSGQE